MTAYAIYDDAYPGDTVGKVAPGYSPTKVGAGGSWSRIPSGKLGAP
jgi:hypothetical protein